MGNPCNRRELLRQVGRVVFGTLAGTAGAEPAQPSTKRTGRVIGHPEAAQVGAEVLEAGGNAVDAAVAAALVAGVVGIHQCGIAGYGGHLVIALPEGPKVVAIDFNTAA